MIRQMKAILLKITVIAMVVSILGIPSFYHHCLLHGDHNWKTAFISDTYSHCICCEDVEGEHVHACAESLPSCCENTQHHQNETAIAHSTCCNIKMISLQVIATEYLPKPQHKQSLNFIFCFDIPYQYITNRIFPILDFSLPLPYHGFSPPQAAIFLFTQFLL
jgi:hypothetical protein